MGMQVPRVGPRTTTFPISFTLANMGIRDAILAKSYMGHLGGVKLREGFRSGFPVGSEDPDISGWIQLQSANMGVRISSLNALCCIEAPE